MINIESFNLDNKIALVTGGNTGLGMAYVEALCNLGCDIAITNFMSDCNEIKDYVENKGRKFLAIEADLTKQEDMEHVLSEVISKYGRIDILVNNAGTIKRNPLLEFPKEDWDQVININLSSVFFISQAVAKIMMAQGGGKIINIASMLSYQGGVFVPSYAASKHGIAGLTKSFANELAAHNIQVNAIAPGYVKTENTLPIREDEKRNKEILSRIPANYWADPADIAGGVCFLASDAAKYVNGVIIPIDGGWQAR